jgi:hypothetical protein
MSTDDRLPENWRGTRRDPRLPDMELGVAEDGEYVVLFDWPELDAYIRASRECCIELGGDSPVR